jgi:hypothetical protein
MKKYEDYELEELAFLGCVTIVFMPPLITAIILIFFEIFVF